MPSTNLETNQNGWFSTSFLLFHQIFVRWSNWMVAVLLPLTWTTFTVVWSTGTTVWHVCLSWMPLVSSCKTKNGCSKKPLMLWSTTVVVVVQSQGQVAVHWNPWATCSKGNKDASVKTCSVNGWTSQDVPLSPLVQLLRCTNVVCHVKWPSSSSNHSWCVKLLRVISYKTLKLQNAWSNAEMNASGIS